MIVRCGFYYKGTLWNIRLHKGSTSTTSLQVYSKEYEATLAYSYNRMWHEIQELIQTITPLCSTICCTKFSDSVNQNVCMDLRLQPQLYTFCKRHWFSGHDKSKCLGKFLHVFNIGPFRYSQAIHCKLNFALSTSDLYRLYEFSLKITICLLCFS